MITEKERQAVLSAQQENARQIDTGAKYDSGIPFVCPAINKKVDFIVLGRTASLLNPEHLLENLQEPADADIQHAVIHQGKATRSWGAHSSDGRATGGGDYRYRNLYVSSEIVRLLEEVGTKLMQVSLEGLWRSHDKPLSMGVLKALNLYVNNCSANDYASKVEFASTKLEYTAKEVRAMSWYKMTYPCVIVPVAYKSDEGFRAGYLASKRTEKGDKVYYEGHLTAKRYKTLLSVVSAFGDDGVLLQELLCCALLEDTLIGNKLFPIINFMHRGVENKDFAVVDAMKGTGVQMPEGISRIHVSDNFALTPYDVIDAHIGQALRYLLAFVHRLQETEVDELYCKLLAKHLRVRAETTVHEQEQHAVPESPPHSNGHVPVHPESPPPNTVEYTPHTVPSHKGTLQNPDDLDVDNNVPF